MKYLCALSLIVLVACEQTKETNYQPLKTYGSYLDKVSVGEGLDLPDAIYQNEDFKSRVRVEIAEENQDWVKYHIYVNIPREIFCVSKKSGNVISILREQRDNQGHLSAVR